MEIPSSLPQPDARPSGLEQKPLIDRIAVAELVASGDTESTGASSPIPITIWRVAALEATYGGHDDDALTAAVTTMIVATYSRRGDTIVSLGADPVLAGTAGAAGCDYRAVTTAADLADLDHVAGRVGLIVLRWPPRGHGNPIDAAATRDMFAACRMLLHRDGATIVTLTPDPVSDGYQQHSRTLIPAAYDSGLDLIRHIVAVTEPVTGPTGRIRLTSNSPVTIRDDARLAIRQHILMFVLGGDRHD
jgi:hypothetical protein